MCVCNTHCVFVCIIYTVYVCVCVCMFIFTVYNYTYLDISYEKIFSNEFLIYIKEQVFGVLGNMIGTKFIYRPCYIP